MLGLRLAALVALPALLAVPSCAAQPEGIVDVKSGLASRPALLGCRGFDVRAGEGRFVRVFPALTFERPLALVHHPTDPVWYVLEQGGTIRRFEDRADVARSEPVIDLRAGIASDGYVAGIGFEDGLLGLAFDPTFATTGRVVLKYTARDPKTPARLQLVVARAQSLDGGATIEPATIEELLSVERPADTLHHGGPPAYGRDGLLYVPVGDGGYSNGDVAQDLGSLGGKILRIDTRVTPYGIPPDNPFVRTTGARPEIFALGLRNPHGWSFDPDEAILWIGDVGFRRYEELNRARGGENFGWPIREGAHCKGDQPCDPSGLVDPVYEYAHRSTGAIIAGPVYRGARFPSARGNVVIADFVTGRIAHVPRTGGGSAQLLVGSGRNITSLASTLDGEILATDHTGGIWTVEPNVAGRSAPVLLSETGCVDPRRPAEAPPWLIPYDVAMPLWSDGTTKSRWMAVPDGATVSVDEDGGFEMPIGSVLVKTFSSGARPIETRLLVRHADGEWGGYSYEWNDDGTDATLLEGDKAKDVAGLPYTFPSRAQCLACHTKAAGFTLGLETSQLDFSMIYGGQRRANQLATLEHIGLFSAPLAPPAAQPSFPRRDDAHADDHAWSRAYLHANCSHCHMPAGPGRGNIDLRSWTSLGELGCDVRSSLDGFDLSEPRIIAPGTPERSVLLARMRHAGDARMPPLATSAVDALAIERIGAWIAGLRSCGHSDE